jgi:hypothetical protein
VLRERVDAGLLPGRHPERLGPGLGRRHPLGQCGSGRADETAALEDLERAEALADEVRRRFEAGVPADAPTGEQADPIGAEVPAGRFRGVAGVRILGKQHDERAAQPLVERSEDERQCRLGDACAGALEFARERREALALGELAREHVQYRPVHDERRNSEFRGPSWYSGLFGGRAAGCHGDSRRLRRRRPPVAGGRGPRPSARSVIQRA